MSTAAVDPQITGNSIDIKDDFYNFPTGVHYCELQCYTYCSILFEKGGINIDKHYYIPKRLEITAFIF